MSDSLHAAEARRWASLMSFMNQTTAAITAPSPHLTHIINHDQEDMTNSLLTRHYGITCRGCAEKDFNGIRYQCATKKCGYETNAWSITSRSYNLCEICYTNPAPSLAPMIQQHRLIHPKFHAVTGDQTHLRRIQRESSSMAGNDYEFTESSAEVIIQFMDKLIDYLMDWTKEGIRTAAINITSSASSSSSSSLASELSPPPRFLLPQLHPHPLHLYRLIHLPSGVSGYRCDLCHHKGFELVYSCSECPFDLHPVCFKESGGCDLHPQPSPNHPRIQAPVTATSTIDLAERIELYIPSIQHLLPKLSKDIDDHRQADWSFMEDATLAGTLDRYHLRHHLPPTDQLQLTPTEMRVLKVIVSWVLSKLTHSARWMAGEMAGRVRPINFFEAIYEAESFGASWMELPTLCSFLDAPFSIKSPHPVETISTANWNSALSFRIPPPHPFPHTTPFEVMLDYTFRANLIRLKQLNSREWYFDPIKVKQYAREYAQLRLQPGDSFFYRLYGITPIAYYGSLDNGLIGRGDDPGAFFDDSMINDWNHRCFTFRYPHPQTNAPVTVAMDMNYLAGRKPINEDDYEAKGGTFELSEIFIKWIDISNGTIIHQVREEYPNTPNPTNSSSSTSSVLTAASTTPVAISSSAASTTPVAISSSASMTSPLLSLESARSTESLPDDSKMAEVPTTTTTNPISTVPQMAHAALLSANEILAAAELASATASEDELTAMNVQLRKEREELMQQLQLLQQLNWQLRQQNIALQHQRLLPSACHPMAQMAIPPHRTTCPYWSRQLEKCVEAANQLFAEQRSQSPELSEVDKEKRLSKAFQMIAAQLCLFEDYPTHIWEANHPLSVRHYFTQELIREHSRLVGLPDLPNDLFHLIGEYEPAYLPSPPGEDDQIRYRARIAFARRDIDSRSFDSDQE